MILLPGFERADAIASLVIVAVMARAAVHLLRSSGRVLSEGVPDELSLGEVRRHLLATHHDLDLHDLQAWVVSSGLPALSVHVVIDEECLRSGEVPGILDALQACLAGHSDLEHSTFQLEPPGHSLHERSLHGLSPLERREPGRAPLHRVRYLGRPSKERDVRHSATDEDR